MSALGTITPAAAPPVVRGAPAPERGLVKLLFFMSPGKGDWMGPFIPIWQTSSPPSLRTNTGCGVGGTPAVIYPEDSEGDCKLILVKTTRHLSSMASKPSIKEIFSGIGLIPAAEVDERSARFKPKKPISYVPLFGSVMRKPDSELLKQFSQWDSGKKASPINFSDLVKMSANDIRTLYQNQPLIYLDTQNLAFEKTRNLIRRLSSILQIPCYILFERKNLDDSQEKPK